MHICMYECSTLPQPVYLFAVLSLSLSLYLPCCQLSAALVGDRS